MRLFNICGISVTFLLICFSHTFEFPLKTPGGKLEEWVLHRRERLSKRSFGHKMSNTINLGGLHLHLKNAESRVQ